MITFCIPKASIFFRNHGITFPIGKFLVEHQRTNIGRRNKWITDNGGMTRENGDRFRKYILSVGNSVDLNQAFKDFTGRTPDIKPLLQNKGFVK